MPCRSLGTGARCGPTDLLAKGRRIVAELQRWRNNNNEPCADGQPLCSQWRSLAVSPRAVPGLPRELSQAGLLTTALRPNVGLWRGGIPYLPGREAQRPATKGKTRTSRPLQERRPARWPGTGYLPPLSGCPFASAARTTQCWVAARGWRGSQGFCVACPRRLGPTAAPSLEIDGRALAQFRAGAASWPPDSPSEPPTRTDHGGGSGRALQLRLARLGGHVMLDARVAVHLHHPR